MKNKVAIFFTVAVLVFGVVFYLYLKMPSHQTAPTATDRTSPVPPAVSNISKTDESAPIQQEGKEALAAPKLPLIKTTSQNDGSIEIADVDDNQTIEPDFTQEELEDIYLRAQVFRDEALDAFPLYSVEIHRPKGLDPGYIEENGIRIYKSYGPPPNEVWIRIRPENAREMKEIMAQTADLYRDYMNQYPHPVRIVHWVGGQIFAAATYNADGQAVVH